MKHFTLLILLTSFSTLICLGQCNSFPATLSDEDCSSFTSLSNNSNVNSGTSFGMCGSSSTTESFTGINLSGGTIRVCGDVSLSGNFNSGVIVVACGATLRLPSGIAFNNNLGIINYGTVRVTGNMTFQNSNNYFYNESDSSILFISGNLSFPQNNGQNAYLKNNGFIKINNSFNAYDGGYTCLGPESKIKCTNLYYINNCGGPSNRFTYSESSNTAIIRYTNICRLRANLTTSNLIHIYRATGASAITNSGCGSGGKGSAVVTTNAPAIANPSSPSICAAANCFNTLPITLVRFEVNPLKNGSFKIKWTTATEINNDYFTLERSADAVHFKSIAVVNGNGNSSTPINYNWIDNHPIKGTVYYRLKQTDFNGNVEYHSVIATSSEQLSGINIYPNPFKNSFTVKLLPNTIYPVTTEVIDHLGRKIYINTVEANTTEITLDELPVGTYFVKVFNETAQFIERMVKMN